MSDKHCLSVARVGDNISFILCVELSTVNSGVHQLHTGHSQADRTNDVMTLDVSKRQKTHWSNDRKKALQSNCRQFAQLIEVSPIKGRPSRVFPG